MIDFRRRKRRKAKAALAICANCRFFDGRDAEHDLQKCQHPSVRRSPAIHPVTGKPCYTDGQGFYIFEYPLADLTNPRGKCENFSQADG